MKIKSILFFISFFSVMSVWGGISGDNCVDKLTTEHEYTMNAPVGTVSYQWYSSYGYIQGSSTGASVIVEYYDYTANASLTCWAFDINGSTTDVSTYYITVTPRISWIDGSFNNIIEVGNYTYSIDDVPGATSYTWGFPSGFTGSSSTSSITLNAGTSATSGVISVTPNGVQLCEQTRSAIIQVSECFERYGEYDAYKITNRVVSGDFDRDGKEDDLAAFYNYGTTNTALHVWKGNGMSEFEYQGDNGWWNATTYDADKIIDVVSGDFDRDGYKDDIAVFYNYGNDVIRIHVWESNGTTFGSINSNGWYYNSTYNGNKIKGRVVSGDFDRDGYSDDIAAFYDYGSTTMAIHVWNSTGSSFGSINSNGWYYNTTYDANKVTDRIVSGDFDRDGYVDDIAAFYNYGSTTTAIHVWNSTGSSFGSINSNGWYYSTTYDANKVSGRIVSGDFDNDGFKDDITGVYDYGNDQTAMHVWRSQGNSFLGPTTNGWWNSSTYDASKLTGRIVSGNFLQDSPNNSDIAGFYSYGFLSSTIHVWNAFSGPFMKGQKFNYVGDNGWWSICYDPNGMPLKANMEDNSEAKESDLNLNTEINERKFVIYPNPSNDGIFKIKNFEFGNSIKTANIYGQIVESIVLTEGSELILDFSHLAKGVYLVSALDKNGSTLQLERIVIK